MIADNKELLDDVKKFLGDRPYQGPENPSRSDPYFAAAAERKYGPAWWEAVNDARGSW